MYIYYRGSLGYIDILRGYIIWLHRYDIDIYMIYKYMIFIMLYVYKFLIF